MTEAGEHRASWLELFFDLVVVGPAARPGSDRSDQEGSGLVGSAGDVLPA
ncbi:MULTISPECIES: hypothetical protein [unclassified Nonomuraea]